MKRDLTDHEKQNLAIVQEAVLDVAVMFLTDTGLRKNILDAVLPLRTMLANAGVHDYSKQTQGPQNRAEIPAVFLLNDKRLVVRTSLYRPVTKKGDPRIWFSGLGQHANSNDVLAVFAQNNSLYVLNLTQSDIGVRLDKGQTGPDIELLNTLRTTSYSVADELLAKLVKVAALGPLRAVGESDSAVGETVEAALGIRRNPSKRPDYKGIELKSYRQTSLTIEGTRATLFAQVPDWTLSRFKSSASILDAFGYFRGEVKKLYCTVSLQSANPQGLQLRVAKDLNQLMEYHRNGHIEDVAIWPLSLLHNRLLTKHRETFWIRAVEEIINGRTHFILKSVKHTRGPSLPQFDGLLEHGLITVDHLISRKKGRVKEKGPLFKLPKRNISDLFPTKPHEYSF